VLNNLTVKGARWGWRRREGIQKTAQLCTTIGLYFLQEAKNKTHFSGLLYPAEPNTCTIYIYICTHVYIYLFIYGYLCT